MGHPFFSFTKIDFFSFLSGGLAVAISWHLLVLVMNNEDPQIALRLVNCCAAIIGITAYMISFIWACKKYLGDYTDSEITPEEKEQDQKDAKIIKVLVILCIFITAPLGTTIHFSFVAWLCANLILHFSYEFKARD